MSVKFEKWSGLWRCQFQINKQSFSSTFKTRAEGEAWEAHHRKEAAARRTGKPVEHTIAEAIERWATEELPFQKAHKATANHAKQIVPLIKGQKLTEIQTLWADIKKTYADKKPATINRKGAILRRICNLAYNQWGWLDRPIKIQLLTENNARHNYLTKEQFIRIARSVPRHARAVFYLLVYTGMRFSELKRSRAQDGCLVISDSKGGMPRIVPIHRKARPYLNQLPMKYGHHWYWDRLDEARKELGIDTNIHDLRHTAASWMIAGGGDLATVRDFMGHSNLATTSRYSHIYTGRLKDAIDRM
jgi:integrase